MSTATSQSITTSLGAPTVTDQDREFRAELAALLRKFNATIEIDDHFKGFAECGRELRATVTIEGIYEGDNTRPQVDFDLGTYITGEEA